jgi:hypothetical protein
MSASPSFDNSKPEQSTLSRFKARMASRPGATDRKDIRYFRYTLLLGGIAGLVFSLALWAFEAILLIEAHVAYPWLPVLVGTVSCILISMLAASLTYLVNRALLGAVIWILAARLISELAIVLPLKVAPALMSFFEPGLRNHLPAYPITDTLQTWAGFGTVWLGIFFGILGLLQLTLVESGVPATTAAGRFMPYFIFIPVMLLSSVMSSNMINEQLRAPLIATDRLIQFAVDHQNSNVNPTLARQMHLSAVNTISGVLNRPRRLFLGQYDEYFGQVNILVDFDGEWVDCSTVSAQPVFCQFSQNP